MPPMQKSAQPSPITLKHLIDERMIFPGDDELHMGCMDIDYRATLECDGTISGLVGGEYQNFPSPSFFSAAVMRHAMGFQLVRAALCQLLSSALSEHSP